MKKLDPNDEHMVELNRMLASPGWQKGALPALQGELAKARRQLEGALATDVAKIAGLQDRIKWLKRLLEDPRKVLTPRQGKIEEETEQ